MGALHPDYIPSRFHLPRVDSTLRIDAETDAEARRRVEALDQAHLRLARENFPAFFEYAFLDEVGVPLRLQWFHEQWIERMNTARNLVVVCCRDHGKSTVAMARVLWELGRNHNLRVKVVCASDARAKERLYEVKQHLVGNPRVRAVFPDLVEDPDGEWSRHRIVVKRTARHRDATLEALGVTSTITGGRADLLVGDDPVDRRNALAFPALRDSIKLAWRSDWMNLLEPASRAWVFCTLWHKADLNHELLANPSYQKLFYAVPNDFGSLWPEKWPEGALRDRAAEIGSVEFNRAFRNVANDESMAPFRPQWAQFCRAGDIPDDLVTICAYDTAVGLGREHDYTAGAIGGVDLERRRVYVLDAWRARLTIRQQAEAIFHEWERWNPERVRIERVGQAAVDQWLLDAHPEMARVVETVTPGTGQGKTARFAAVSPMFERGDVVFAPHLNPDNSAWDPARGNLIGELLDFPVGRHDDMVDALTHMLDHAWRVVLGGGTVRGRGRVQLRVVGSTRAA
jgi:predicted phage terminase large subunit-like protein